MYENIKYQMQFDDVLGKSWELNFHVKDYAGAITALTGNRSPVKIEGSVNNENPFDPIRDVKITANVLIPRFDVNFYEDLIKEDDQWCWTELKSGGVVKYSG
ncbi:MAG: hypothetical protein J7539_13280, partial [Niabella sp.]|nr:hypothetical protein [Niabella sp.]